MSVKNSFLHFDNGENERPSSLPRARSCSLNDFCERDEMESNHRRCRSDPPSSLPCFSVGPFSPKSPAANFSPMAVSEFRPNAVVADYLSPAADYLSPAAGDANQGLVSPPYSPTEARRNSSMSSKEETPTESSRSTREESSQGPGSPPMSPHVTASNGPLVDQHSDEDNDAPFQPNAFEPPEDENILSYQWGELDLEDETDKLIEAAAQKQREAEIEEMMLKENEEKYKKRRGNNARAKAGRKGGKGAGKGEGNGEHQHPRGTPQYTHANVPRTKNLLEVYGSPGELMPSTTIMVRNIPNRYRQKELVIELNQNGLKNTYDFVYLPMDKSTTSNVGYAFVNFTTEEYCKTAIEKFDGYRFKKYQTISRKIAKVSVAHIQGLANNIKHYKQSAVNESKIKEHRPLVKTHFPKKTA